MLFISLTYYYYTIFFINICRDYRLYHTYYTDYAIKRYIRRWIWIWIGLVLVQISPWFSSYKTSFLDSAQMLSRVIFPLTSAPRTVLCRGPPAWLTGRWFHFNLGPKPPVDPVLTRASQALTSSRPTNRDESWHVSAHTHSLPAQHLFDWMDQIFQFWKRICVIKTTWWQYYVFMQCYSY